MAVWKKIRSDREYRKALNRIEKLLDVTRTDAEQNEFTLLSYLIEEYEASHTFIEDATPLEVIRFVMDMKAIRQTDLVPILGSKGYVSRIINGTAPIPVDSLYPLSIFLGVPVETLIPKLLPKERVFKESGSGKLSTSR